MKLLKPQASDVACRRPAFSMIEMTIAASILAIGSAVIVPRWSQSVERAKLTNMRRCLETDIEMLRRLSVRRGQQLSLSFAANSGEITIAPPIPEVLGNAAGVVDYADRFPGVEFSAVDLNGNSTCKINHYGELVSVYTGQTLNAGLLTVATDSQSQQSDLLLVQGLVSTPTLPGEEEVPPAEAAAVAAKADETSAATTTTSSSKSFLQKLFGL